MVDVRITGAEQLGGLAKRLKQAGDQGKGLNKELRKAIRDGAKPAVAATKAAVKTIPVTGTRGGGRKAREEHAVGRSKAGTEEKRRAKAQRGSGLRQTIAAAVRLKVATGSRNPRVRIEVDSARLPPDQRTLPSHLDNPKGWRKPTFGHDPWTKQYGKPWFKVTIRRYLPAVRAHIVRAMDDIAKKAEG